MSWDMGLGKAISKGAFKVGYELYKTRLGGAFHQRTCQEYANGEAHSNVMTVPLVPGVHITVVPMLADNYSFLIVDEASKSCLVVDPSDAEGVMKAVYDEELTLAGVLTTHGHWDHAGGNETIRSRCPEAKIYGNTGDTVPALTDNVKEGDMFYFPPRAVTADPKIVIKVWETPCHTRGHIVFLACSITPEFPEGSPVALFSGDTLFTGGTGKFFEGTAQEMAANLQRFAKLPPSTKVFSGHEYALNNYRFAAAVEPDNETIRSKLSAVHQSRVERTPTVPSTIAEELQCNPYMRIVTSRAACGKLAMALHAVTGNADFREGRANSVSVLGELRRVRDENLVKIAR